MDTLDPSDIDHAVGPVLRRIADELVRLGPDRRDPELFHQTKSDLVHELRRLALGLDQAVPRAPRGGSDRSTLQVMPLRAPNLTIVELPERLAVGLSDRQKSCRHCLRRRAQQTRRHRLRLRGLDLFQWAARQ